MIHLACRNLYKRFFMKRVLRGVDLIVNPCETLVIICQSGCGKSVSVLSVMCLIPTPPGRIVGGEVLFQGRDLLKIDEEEIRQIRGNKVAMIFQDPMTSLNPVLTINQQVSESLGT